MNTQEFILSYALPVAASIAVLWVAYRLLFVNSNRFQFNRTFLLVSLLFSLSLPLIGFLMGESAPQIVNFKHSMFPGYTLNEIVITPEGQEVAPITLETITIDSSRHISLWQVLGILYLIGVAVMTVLFLVKLVRLVALIIRSPKRKMDGYTAVYTHKEQGSFSFFRYAFFPDENVSADIVRHEMSHIAHGHSWDILFVEIIKIMQWFNPFIYFYRRELQSLHEYSADHDVVATGIDKKNYMMLILQQCTAVDFSNMSNNFSLILTKKRIKMITRNEKTRRLWWRLLATIPVLALLLIANAKVTAQEKSAVDKPMVVEMGGFEIFDDEGTPLQLKDTVIYNPDGSYIKCETSDGFDPISGEPRKTMTLTAHHADGTSSAPMNLHWETDGDVTRYIAEPFEITAVEPAFVLLESLSPSSDKPVPDSVYNIVDVMPEFPGGAEAMMKYIANNVKYPEEAKEQGISGRVFVQFVIEKDGSVSNVKVLRRIGGGCDEEAVRVVKAMPKWKPGMREGKPVRVSYNLPLNFKLDDGNSAKKNGLEGTSWEGTGKGTKDKVNYTMHMTMEIESANAGYFVMTLKGEEKGQTTVVFEDVGLPFTYTFDGKSMGSINPHNPDGSAMTLENEPPYGFAIDANGDMIVNFFDFKEDIGVEKITFKKNQPVAGKKTDNDKVYDAPETMPEYPGGMEGLRNYIAENLTVPEKYQNMESKAEYRVIVQFVVAADGSITEVTIPKPEPSKKDLNDEAVRVVKGMPKWKPGTVNGKPVKVKYMLPILFKLGK